MSVSPNIALKAIFINAFVGYLCFFYLIPVLEPCVHFLVSLLEKLPWSSSYSNDKERLEYYLLWTRFVFTSITVFNVLGWSWKLFYHQVLEGLYDHEHDSEHEMQSQEAADGDQQVEHEPESSFKSSIPAMMMMASTPAKSSPSFQRSPAASSAIYSKRQAFSTPPSRAILSPSSNLSDGRLASASNSASASFSHSPISSSGRRPPVSASSSAMMTSPSKVISSDSIQTGVNSTGRKRMSTAATTTGFDSQFSPFTASSPTANYGARSKPLAKEIKSGSLKSAMMGTTPSSMAAMANASSNMTSLFASLNPLNMIYLTATKSSPNVLALASDRKSLKPSILSSFSSSSTTPVIYSSNQVWDLLGLDNNQIDTFTDRLRDWFSVHLLHPLVQTMNSNEKFFNESGHGHLSIKTILSGTYSIIW